MSFSSSSAVVAEPEAPTNVVFIGSHGGRIYVWARECGEALRRLLRRALADYPRFLEARAEGNADSAAWGEAAFVAAAVSQLSAFRPGLFGVRDVRVPPWCAELHVDLGRLRVQEVDVHFVEEGEEGGSFQERVLAEWTFDQFLARVYPVSLDDDGSRTGIPL